MTEKLYDVTALGEILIDFTEWGFSDDGARLFAQNPGGAVANVACAASKLGLRTAYIGRAAFVGKVGADMHGAFLRQTLREAGVDVSGVATDAERFTTLAFVKLAENGERSFSFARYDAADTNLRWEEVPRTLLTDTRVLSVGTLGMTSPCAPPSSGASRRPRPPGRISPSIPTTGRRCGAARGISSARRSGCWNWQTM